MTITAVRHLKTLFNMFHRRAGRLVVLVFSSDWHQFAVGGGLLFTLWKADLLEPWMTH